MERMFVTKNYQVELIDVDYRDEYEDTNCGFVTIDFRVDGIDYVYDEWVVDNKIDRSCDSRWNVGNMDQNTIDFLETHEYVHEWLLEQAQSYIDTHPGDFSIEDDGGYTYEGVDFDGMHTVTDKQGCQFHFQSKQEAKKFVECKLGGLYVLAVRKLLNKTQEQFAELLQLSRRHICSLESGEATLKHQTRLAMQHLLMDARVLGYTDEHNQLWNITIVGTRVMYSSANYHETFEYGSDEHKMTDHWFDTHEMIDRVMNPHVVDVNCVELLQEITELKKKLNRVEKDLAEAHSAVGRIIEMVLPLSKKD